MWRGWESWAAGLGLGLLGFAVFFQGSFAAPIAPLAALLFVCGTALIAPRRILASCLLLSIVCAWWLLQGPAQTGPGVLSDIVSEIEVPVASRTLTEGSVVESGTVSTKRIVSSQAQPGTARRLDEVTGKLVVKSVPAGGFVPLDALDDWLDVPVLTCAIPAGVRVGTDANCGSGPTIQRRRVALRALPGDSVLRDDDLRDHLTLRALPSNEPISAAALSGYRLLAVPRDTIPAGTVLAPAMVEARPVAVGLVDEQSIEPIEDVVGRVAVRPLQKGLPIRRSSLAAQIPDAGLGVAVAVPIRFIAADTSFTIDDLTWILLPFPSLGPQTLVKIDDVVPTGQTATANVNLLPGQPIERSSIRPE